MDPLFSKLMVRDIPDVPPDIVEAFESGEVTEVPFEKRMCLLTDPSIRGENGIVESLDGSVQAAVSCFMPGVTLDMISWWAWWFPRDSDRFRIWLPDSNVRLTYDEKDADYFEAPEQPELRPFTLFPVQVIGGLPMPFRIDLYPPEEFFPEQAVKDAGGPLVYCARLGTKKGKFLYSRFVYMFFEEEGGVRFSARFWIGTGNGNRFLSILLINRRRMAALGISCYREYDSLHGILPELYAEYGPDRAREPEN